MVTIVKRVVGALLALVGLALTVLGVWFATQLGSSGTAQFTARPDTTDPVLIRPDVLNRVDADVTVTATPLRAARSGWPWRTRRTPPRCSVRPGTSTSPGSPCGTGCSARPRAAPGRPASSVPPTCGASRTRGSGSVTLTVRQSEAPETLVVATDGAPLRSLSFTVVDKTWFVEAVVAALVGLFLLIVGVVLLWPRRHPRTADVAVPAVPTTPGAPGATADPSDAPDPEEVTR